MNNPKEKHLFLPPILQLPSPAAEKVKKKITTKKYTNGFILEMRPYTTLTK